MILWKFHREYAIPLLPGEAGGKALKDFIATILDKKTPESHLSTDIPTRGTSVVVGAAFSEAEIVKSVELSESFMKNSSRHYDISYQKPTSKLELIISR